MKTFIYYIAERIPGYQEMQRFSHPIHVGVVTAEHVVAAYECVVDDLRPTFADHPQPLEVRFEEMAAPLPRPADNGGGAGDGSTVAGVWRHRKPVDMDITFTSAD